ncbi:hypothetical protein [Pedobacter alpinus]|uniref:Uncharacterized protein n=1 Tax=Pedobacter alpinus TaxID=1590643 RepID=A0ABW5TVG9_9SPHI
MKTTTATQQIKSLISNFDNQLLSIIKQDLQEQNLKVKTKLVNMATHNYDLELLAIIKSDINTIKSHFNNTQIDFAKAG